MIFTKRPDTWRFAEHQWNYIGNGGAYGNVSGSTNESITDNEYKGWIDLFGWGTWTGYNPDFKPANLANLYDSNYRWDSKDFNQEAKLANERQRIYNWRTLNIDEWAYLLGARQVTKRFTFAKLNYSTQPTYPSTQGLIIFPDSFEDPIDPNNFTWQNMNEVSDFANHITEEQWAALENAGCVFLPSAGIRTLNNYTSTMTNYKILAGQYWSSTPDNSGAVNNQSFYLSFQYSTQYPTDPNYTFIKTNIAQERRVGCAVRLVYDVN